MKTDTQAMAIPATRDEVFQFLADPQNLPRWAVGFAHAIRHEDDGWIVRTAHGEIRLRIQANAETGTIDYHMSPTDGLESVAYSRILPAGRESEYLFTQMQAPGMPDAIFDAQVDALAEELVVLRGIFRARAVCPA